MRFRATIQLEGKTATGIRGKRPPVRVTISDHTYRSTVAPFGDVFMLPLSAENRGAAGVAADDEVDVELELDAEPREVTVPPDFADALDSDEAARRFFDGLSYSNRRVFTLSVDGTTNPETKARRVEKAIALMREGRVR